jgi:hypothetical protein
VAAVGGGGQFVRGGLRVADWGEQFACALPAAFVAGEEEQFAGALAGALPAAVLAGEGEQFPGALPAAAVAGALPAAVVAGEREPFAGSLPGAVGGALPAAVLAGEGEQFPGILPATVVPRDQVAEEVAGTIPPRSIGLHATRVLPLQTAGRNIHFVVEVPREEVPQLHASSSKLVCLIFVDSGHFILSNMLIYIFCLH